ncbi:MAG TPA: 50S ribosomal protein L32 [candidate division WWE3 bacterium]|uniref:Large ribosomal subunit protein bL32 n=1 Tax=candidate division WWE3 bacterium TaxID=2053526 RepID=A0A7C1HV80_UNCKA|nr:50S ribosomal protein L32 [candidate division WWE3 bacterium]
MPVPKRKHSKSRSKIKRFNHYVKKVKNKVTAVVEIRKGVYKRPHVEEEIKL